ncbi:MAG: hypothetical protein JO211_09750, partial [Acidobacteriaceae bacterium]|nr:hypothetical protein [Acidobacteriaceae bacterium]
MASYASTLLLSLALAASAAAQSIPAKPAAPSERIGVVNFANSCAFSQQASLNRA